jgi:hypothetical protein
MSNAVDYVGLVAYMFVMYGGLPGSDSLWSDTVAEHGRRGRRRLTVMKGGGGGSGRQLLAGSDSEEQQAVA